MIYLKAITEDNFMDAFSLKLAPEQERFVSHPVRSLAQAYVYLSLIHIFRTCKTFVSKWYNGCKKRHRKVK